ncbi:hypothetical protein [Hyalangium gracile]|uniref:hypothetical protein n=1 Tax=Hyalangium gracile TaxID=394092 RepID=UPI001CCB7FB2|nr:hypothetical protein [Hyalangium gracile]
MGRLFLAVGFIVSMVLSACASLGSAHPLPKLGLREDIRTTSGRYDGYSVRVDLDHAAVHQGHQGTIWLTGHGTRPIIVTQRTQRGDGMLLPGAPTLRIITPIMMYPDDPRLPDSQAERIQGLNYDFMVAQGWLFQRCDRSPYSFCAPQGREYLATPSFRTVDPLIAYLGQWLTEGDYAGTLRIDVWQHLGTPEDIQTRFGQHEGYTVDWCKGAKDEHRRLIVLTGQGSRDFEPFLPGQPADIERRSNWAVLIGKKGTEGLAVLGKPGCHAPYAAEVDVVSYADVDAAIAWWGRRLTESDARGEIVIRVTGPYLLEYLAR